MKPIRTFAIIPSLPAPLEPLRSLATNLRWAWNHQTIALFRRLDSNLWEVCGHNPVAMLGKIDQSSLRDAAADEAFLAQLEEMAVSLDEYMSAGPATWFTRKHGNKDVPLVAYFSAEFGITESLSIFAGGLGILAGDHLKSASDLGVPLVGVGLLYQLASFKQRLNNSAWQQEIFNDNDFANLPLALEKKADGSPLTVKVPINCHDVFAQIWRVQVGRIPLFLLDTNLPLNQQPEDRGITAQLYGGGRETRIQQELVLGIGGYRALEALGLHPTVFHMNEGHSAFLSLELVRRLMNEKRLSFREAAEEASASLIFTTHTPVEAGHDYFSSDVMWRYMGDYAKAFGIPWSEFLDMGRHPNAGHAEFCMTALALRLASFSNGVSKLHGEVSRRMWADLWPGLPADEVPIGHVTNGVHFQSWVSPDLHQLYDRYLGPRWREEPADREVWRHVDNIPSEELWRCHERRRERLVAFSRKRLTDDLSRRGAPVGDIMAAEDVLDSRILTIGFARRFATYKRANLFLRNPERLVRILNDEKRPVQIILAGKAHPSDDAGKELIRRIVNVIREYDLRSRLVFLENYDMTVARYLVQGVDVWLNTPLRPLEACGTSGMKAAANGVLNFSTLDGWWDEAWVPDIQGVRLSPGWAIGRAENYPDRETQDQVEAETFYDLLETDLAPTFYDRRSDGIPRRWLARMKAAIASLSPVYNTHRMVREYVENFYLVAHQRHSALAAQGGEYAKELAAWKDKVRACWPQVRIESVETQSGSEISVGCEVKSRAKVRLGALSPDDVAVELYEGKLDSEDNITSGIINLMQAVARDGDLHVFETSFCPCSESGRHGYTIRVKPVHRETHTELVPGCFTWAS